ncbi:myb-like DNA-binding domain-containing protein [Vairimorpha necatrix]|uniref:Myb-like DNA-binding domain-containing protein n=1 Tax=Vairimorpha necatrix TaxID=6039 RepID=A0AAX4JCY2_9MICR
MGALTEQEKNLELEKNYQILADEDLVDLYAYADKREGIIWTPEEIELLKEGIEKFGQGNWKTIFDNYKQCLNKSRRKDDLREKFRVLMHLKHRHLSVKDFYEVDKHNNPILVMGEKVIIRSKEHFDAAQRIAFTKNYTGKGNIIFRIAYEEMGKTWVHVYSAKYNRDSKIKTRIRVKKICGESPYRKHGMSKN